LKKRKGDEATYQDSGNEKKKKCRKKNCLREKKDTPGTAPNWEQRKKGKEPRKKFSPDMGEKKEKKKKRRNQREKRGKEKNKDDS